jgi:hypothetical protein
LGRCDAAGPVMRRRRAHFPGEKISCLALP